MNAYVNMCNCYSFRFFASYIDAAGPPPRNRDSLLRYRMKIEKLRKVSSHNIEPAHRLPK